MPYYIFENPETEERVDVFFHMNDEKKYFDKNGLEWRRVFTPPQASIDAKIDPNSSNAFIDKTSTKKGTYGDLQNLSKELSEKRKEKIGFDPVEKKYLDEYSKARSGRKHQSQKVKTIKNPFFTVDV